MFNNVITFRLFGLNTKPEEMNKALENRRAKDPDKNQRISYGFDSPFGQTSNEVLHSVMGYHRTLYVESKRSLTKSAVDARVEDECAQYQKKHKDVPSKNEIKDIRHNVIAEMLPGAFIERKKIEVIFHSQSSLLFINVATFKKASLIAADLTSVLKCKAVPLAVNHSPTSCMTNWALESPPQDIQLGENFELIDTLDKSSNEKGTFKSSSMHNKNIQNLLFDGMQIQYIDVIWKDITALRVTAGLTLKSIKMLDTSAYADQSDDDSERAIQDRLLIMQGHILHDFITALVVWFGGEPDYSEELAAQELLKKRWDEEEAKINSTDGKQEVQTDMFEAPQEPELEQKGAA